MKFRKKPVVIEAFRLASADSTDTQSYPRWFIDAMLNGSIKVDPLGRVIIATLEGAMTADAGDWIIKGVKDELYPCKDEIFRLTYEEETS